MRLIPPRPDDYGPEPDHPQLQERPSSRAEQRAWSEVRAAQWRARELARPDSYDLTPYDRDGFKASDFDFSYSAVNVNAVYRIDPNGNVTQLLHWPHIHMPNGIVTSPDNRTLYLIEAHPAADHRYTLRPI